MKKTLKALTALRDTDCKKYSLIGQCALCTSAVLYRCTDVRRCAHSTVHLRTAFWGDHICALAYTSIEQSLLLLKLHPQSTRMKTFISRLRPHEQAHIRLRFDKLLYVNSILCKDCTVRCIVLSSFTPINIKYLWARTLYFVMVQKDLHLSRLCCIAYFGRSNSQNIKRFHEIECLYFRDADSRSGSAFGGCSAARRVGRLCSAAAHAIRVGTLYSWPARLFGYSTPVATIIRLSYLHDRPWHLIRFNQSTSSEL